MGRQWHNPLTLPKTEKKVWEAALTALVNGKRFPGFASQEHFLEGVEDVYAAYRWSNSPKLTFHATRRVVELLSSTYFENISVSDIFLPEGASCMQVIAEKDDPILRQNLIFIAPTEQFSRYVLVSGTHSEDMAVLAIDGECTVGDAQETLDPSIERQVDPNYLAVLAAIGFVADSDEYGLIRHEVLNKDRDKYLRAKREGDEALAKFLEDRANRRGKNVRIIDTFELDVGESAPPGVAASPSFGSSKRAHIRRGHFRAVRYGSGRRQVKMKWIPPVLVRADLLSDE